MKFEPKIVLAIVLIIGFMIFNYIVLIKPSPTNIELGGRFCEEHEGLRKVKGAIIGDVAYCNEVDHIANWFFWKQNVYVYDTYKRNGADMEEMLANFFSLFIPLVIVFVLEDERFEMWKKGRKPGEERKRKY